MAAPAVAWLLGGVVVGVIIGRHIDRRAIRDIAVVFLFECFVIIFKMVKDIKRAVAAVFDQAGPSLCAAQKGAQASSVKLVLALFCPTRYRDHQIIAKSAQIGRGRGQVLLGKATKGFGGQQVLLDAVEMVQHRHGPPADTKGGMHVALRPIHHAEEFGPVRHVLEGQVFDGRTCDDQPVKLLTTGLDLGEGAVECFHVFGGGIFGLMLAHPDQVKVDLQGCGADKPCKLRFGLDFFRHQVQKTNPQRPDVLGGGPVGRHNHNPFGTQNVKGGQGLGQGDGHREPLVVLDGNGGIKGALIKAVRDQRIKVGGRFHMGHVFCRDRDAPARH